MKEVIYVFLGGGIGSVLRYICSLWFKSYHASFPFTTLIVNAIASLILGYVFFSSFKLRMFNDEEVKQFVGIGFCGGLSTYSTFTNDTFRLLNEQSYGLALLNILLNLSICLVFLFSGYKLSRLI